MSNRKHAFRLREYPFIDREFHEYVNEIGQNFMDEIHPLLKSIPREPVSEGGAEIIERLDGTRDTMTFNEVSVDAELEIDVFIHSKFDEIINLAHQVANEMGSKVVRDLLNTVSKSAEEYGNVFRVEELNLDVICQWLERVDLTFNDEGLMDQGFVIPSQISDQFNQLIFHPRVQAIIDKKRRDYFAKKGN